MKIGDGVLVSAVCKPEYDLDGNRTVFRYPCEPFAANVTGIKHVKLGKYVKGSRYGGWDEPEGFDPPELKVTGSRRLLAIKVGLLNKEILADPADTTPCEYESPLRGKNPQVKEIEGECQPIEIPTNEADDTAQSTRTEGSGTGEVDR